MSKPANSTQVAFLLDVSTCRQHGDHWKEAVSLGIFRILCFLSSRQRSLKHGEAQQKSLKWGYKLFDIDGNCGSVRAVTTGFKHFNTKTFEEFEKDLLNVSLRETTADSHTCSQSLTQPSHKHSKGSGARKGTKLFNFPVKTLSKCLTETLHDFPWEVLEIGSPVKRRSRSEIKKEKHKSNYVFLISRIPCDKKTMRHYCNKVVIDESVFMESFMPDLLKQELLVERSIKVFWIDSGRYLQQDETEVVRLFLFVF
jgi:hypothetical protein